MPTKKSIRLLGNIFWIAVIYTVIAGGCYWFTKNKATDAVAAAVLTLFILIGTVLRSHLQTQGKTHKRRTKLILSILVVGIVAVYLASCAKAATTTTSAGNKFGGWEWSSNLNANLGYAALPGCGWVKVWHNGYAPIGGYRDYTFSLTVHHWCWTTQMFDTKTTHGPVQGWKFVGRPTFTYGFDPSPTASWEGLIPSSTISRWEGCWIHGIWTPRGCYRIVIQAQIKHIIPPGFFAGGPDGHPKLTIVINARGVVTYVDYSLNKWFPW